MNTEASEPQTLTSTSRRDLIKKAAVGAGAVWAAPTLITSLAYADGTGPDTDIFCRSSTGCLPQAPPNPPSGTSCVFRAQSGDANQNVSAFDTVNNAVLSGAMVRYTVGGVPNEDNGAGCNPNIWNNVCSYPVTGGLTGSWTRDGAGPLRTVTFNLPAANNCAFRDVGVYVVANTTRNGQDKCVPNAVEPTQVPIYSVPDTRFPRYPASGLPPVPPCDATNQRFKQVLFEGVDGNNPTNPGNAPNQAYNMFRMAIQCIQPGGPNLCP